MNLNDVSILKSFINQCIFFFLAYGFLRLRYWPLRFREKFPMSDGSIVMILCIHFIFGTWLRYVIDLPLTGIFGYISI